MKFKKTTPCKSCPYRTDAKLGLWSKEHFVDLLHHDKDIIGATYYCHCKDDSVCRGWLTDQFKRDLPSVALRMQLAKQRVPLAYLESLHSPVPLYDSLAAMCLANFPDIELPPPTDTELFWQQFFADVDTDAGDDSEESSEITDPQQLRSASIDPLAP